MFTNSEHHAPHTLRISILLLRLALGLNFFYLGWSALFDRPLVTDLQARSMGPLYRWLAMANPLAASPIGTSPFGTVSVSSTIIAWLFLIIGACLILGFLTRSASIAGIVLILLNYLPAVGFAHFSFAELVSDDLVIFAALLVLFFGRAGKYLGLDSLAKYARRRRNADRGNA
jgi:uncharacterized membrane protein YphA (DoxX/SURF4 family)